MTDKEKKLRAVPKTETIDTTAGKPKMPKKKRTSKSYAISFGIKVGVTGFVLWIIFRFVAGVFICHTNSAYPTIRDGDFCLTYRLAELKQGTMIVYKQNGETKFGRVIAFSGDKVDISNDLISVNDSYLSENVVYPTSPEGSAISYPYYIPDNCVFVMNDYRSDISDSRTCGGISLDDVQGAVVFTMRMRSI